MTIFLVLINIPWRNLYKVCDQSGVDINLLILILVNPLGNWNHGELAYKLSKIVEHPIQVGQYSMTRMRLENLLLKEELPYKASCSMVLSRSSSTGW